MNGRIKVSRTTPRLQTTFSASYLGKVDNGTPSDNQATVIASNQWLHPESPWFTFATGR